MAVQFRGLLGAMVAIPVVALIGYPLYHLSLSEARRELADLPQDLILVLMAEAIVVPIFLLIRHRRARSRYWLVSDDGIEVVGPGARTVVLRWAAVKSLTAEGGTVTLLPCEGGAVQRLLWVDSKSAAAALQMFSTQK
jgi:hypothetical protein